MEYSRCFKDRILALDDTHGCDTASAARATIANVCAAPRTGSDQDVARRPTVEQWGHLAEVQSPAQVLVVTPPLYRTPEDLPLR